MTKKAYEAFTATSLALACATLSANCQPNGTGGAVMPPPYWNPLTAPGKNPVAPDYLPKPRRAVSPKVNPEILKVKEQALIFQRMVKTNKFEEALKSLKSILSTDLEPIDQHRLGSGRMMGQAVSHHGYGQPFGQNEFIIRDLRYVAEESNNNKFALEVDQQILEAEKKSFGTKDLRVATTLISIGDVKFKTSNFKEALSFYRQSLHIQKLYMAEENALQNLGEKYIRCVSENGESEEASRLKAMRDRGYVRNSKNDYVDVDNLNLTTQNRLAKSIELYKQISIIRPWGYESIEYLQNIVNYSKLLKKNDLLVKYTPLLMEVLERREQRDDSDFRKYTELLVEANLSKGDINSARTWTDKYASGKDQNLSPQELINIANLEIKVKRNKNAERYLEQAEKALTDDFASLRTLRQIENVWKLLNNQEHLAKIQKRITPLEKSFPHLNPWTGTYMSNEERYKGAEQQADEKLKDVKELLRNNTAGATDSFFDDMSTLLQMQNSQNKLLLKIKILDLAKDLFKARRIKEGESIAFIAGGHPSYDSDPLKLSLSELEIAELLLSLNLEPSIPPTTYDYEQFANDAAQFCGESRDPSLSELQSSIRYRLKKNAMVNYYRVYKKPYAGMTWPSVDAPTSYLLNRDMVAARSMFINFDFNNDQENEKLYQSCLKPGYPAVLKTGQNFKPAISPPANARKLDSKSESLNLSAGSYEAKTATMGSLTINTPGSVRLFLTEQSVLDGPVFVAHKNARINSAPSNSSFEIWYDGQGTIQIEDNCTFVGSIYAPNARVEIGKDFKLKGTIAARDISLAGQYTKIMP